MAGVPQGIRTAAILLAGVWLVTYPAGWLIARMMRGRKTELENGLKSSDQDLSRPSRGFADGGAVIGRLERLLIDLFVLSYSLGAVGFLIAAKSIFRFGELSNQKNRLEAEYITIGTLMSFAVGLAVSLGIRAII